MAGVELHKKIIENTQTNGTDQDHFEIYHLSRSHDLSDRTDYLLNKVRENPAEGMFRTVKSAIAAASIHKKEVVFGVPCNTFHAPKIFDNFKYMIKANSLSVHIVHMLDELAKHISEKFPDIQKIGLMTTTGTRTTGVYKRTFDNYNFKIIEIPYHIYAGRIT